MYYVYDKDSWPKNCIIIMLCIVCNFYLFFKFCMYLFSWGEERRWDYLIQWPTAQMPVMTDSLGPEPEVQDVTSGCWMGGRNPSSRDITAGSHGLQERKRLQEWSQSLSPGILTWGKWPLYFVYIHIFFSCRMNIFLRFKKLGCLLVHLYLIFQCPLYFYTSVLFLQGSNK